MTYKNCNRCKKKRPVSSFFRNKPRKDGYASHCKLCEKEAKRRRFNTKTGVISSIYENQASNSASRGHKPPAYGKEELREWLLSSKLFHRLYDKWVESGYNKRHKPSVDRKDDYSPYTLGNIQLMTRGQNNKKGYKDRSNGKNNKCNKAVVQLTREGVVIGEYFSMRQAARESDVSYIGIYSCCASRQKTSGGYVWSYI